MTPDKSDLFKLLDDFIIAEKVIQSMEKKPVKQPLFEQKVRASFLQINDLIDIKLHEICDNAPTTSDNDEGTSEATSGSL